MVSTVLYAFATLCFILLVFSVAVGSLPLLHLGLAFFAAAHLPWPA